MTAFRYEWIANPDQVKEVVDLWEEIWGGGQQVGVAYVISAIRMGGCLLAVYDESEVLVGSNFSFVGEKYGERLLYSHIWAVKDIHRNQNIGFAMLQKLREKAIGSGYDCIGWTFDPMQSRNAYLTFNKIQATSKHYTACYYGNAMENTKLNVGLPADRMTALWRLTQKLRSRDSTGYNETSVISCQGNGIERSPTEINKDLKDERVLIEIPSNLDELMAHDLALARRWRVFTRGAFEHYFETGYQAIDFRLIADSNSKQSFYVLEKRN